MSYFYKIFTNLCIFICVVKESGTSQNLYCPSNCLCDSYNGLNRADCSHQKLISANLDFPKSVEMLNFEYNEITILDNNCFTGLSHLRNLSIAYNAVHTIYLDTFVDLRNLQDLDLSNNRLEQFDERIFERNLFLTSIDLSGNKFMSFQNKPMFISNSIEYLYLIDSQISHVYVSFFEKMPHLLQLDISDNILITLSTAPFVRLKKLKHIKLYGNRWICDGNLEQTINYFKGKNIDVVIDKCKFEIQKSSHNMNIMFERMMELPKKVTTRQPRLLIDTVWNNSNNFEQNKEYDCLYNSFDEICNLYKTCRDNYTNFMNHQFDPVSSRSLLKSPFSGANILFFIGIALGTFIGGVIATSCFLICDRFGIRLRKRQRKRVVRSHSIRRVVQPEPVRMRRPVGSIIATRPQQLQQPDLTRSLSNPERIRTEPQQNGFATFLSGLFDRPARHQYYRTVNQNTVNLIRRISRSSLFINARTNGATNSRDNRENTNHDNERLITDHEHSENLDESFRTEATENVYPTAPLQELPTPQSSSFRRETPTPQSSSFWPETPTGQSSFRPETPPPAYRDVVVNM